ncbi:hypothetical protein LIER_42702 [Lithospermum erythrorhizon]|uniref:Retrovirus-related Pol polyprotein from transposon TNT 1-94 n=1 Tax=Lithospermum erythrorhizon TaxID=34254 RepID=A0AAV3NRQ9_LITER
MKNLPTLLPDNMASVEEKPYWTLILALDDEVITEVAEEDTVAGLWLKLESLYMMKSFTNKLLLKQRLFGLRMQEATSLKNHIDRLNNILLGLRNIDWIEDKDVALILLASLPICIGGSSSGSGLHDALVAYTSQVCDTPVEKFSKRLGRGLKAADRYNYCRELRHCKMDCPKRRGMQHEKASSDTIAIGGMHFEEEMVLVADSHIF